MFLVRSNLFQLVNSCYLSLFHILCYRKILIKTNTHKALVKEMKHN